MIYINTFCNSYDDFVVIFSSILSNSYVPYIVNLQAVTLWCLFFQLMTRSSCRLEKMLDNRCGPDRGQYSDESNVRFFNKYRYLVDVGWGGGGVTGSPVLNYLLTVSWECCRSTLCSSMDPDPTWWNRILKSLITWKLRNKILTYLFVLISDSFFWQKKNLFWNYHLNLKTKQGRIQKELNNTDPHPLS